MQQGNSNWLLCGARLEILVVILLVCLLYSFLLFGLYKGSQKKIVKYKCYYWTFESGRLYLWFSSAPCWLNWSKLAESSKYSSFVAGLPTKPTLCWLCYSKETGKLDYSSLITRLPAQPEITCSLPSRSSFFFWFHYLQVAREMCCFLNSSLNRFICSSIWVFFSPRLLECSKVARKIKNPQSCYPTTQMFFLLYIVLVKEEKKVCTCWNSVLRFSSFVEMLQWSGRE